MTHEQVFHSNPSYMGVLSEKEFYRKRTRRVLRGIDLSIDNIFTIKQPADVLTFTAISNPNLPVASSSLEPLEHRYIVIIKIANDTRFYHNELPNEDILVGYFHDRGFKLTNISSTPA